MKILKNNITNIVLVVLAFVFNIIIFAPIEIYFTNKNEFWFNLKDIIFIIIPLAIIFFIVLFLLGIFFKNKKKNIFLKIVFILTVALYIQGNFLNFGYGVLDGSKINWTAMIGKGLINTAIWMSIILFLCAFKKFKKEDNFKLFSSIVSIFVILIEIVTVSTLIFANKNDFKSSYGLSNENIFNLSNNDNIIVFMSDTFEATYMNRILEEHPEYKDKLKDFTYFDNCTGVSFFTYSSMPTLLTGVECQVGNTLGENVKYCFDNTSLYNVLRDNNYSIELYTEKALQPECDYVENLKKVNSKSTLKTKTDLTKKMYKYTLYRYLPHFLKYKFIVNSDEFNKIKNNNTLPYKEKTYTMDDVAFNKELITNGIGTENKKNVFKFYQTNGMHIPYDTTQNLEYDYSEEYAITVTDEEKRYNEGIASINLLCNYIDELKKSGLYENTTILFLADHGYNNRFNTTLLVKKAYDSHEFTTTSAPVSLLDDLVPTILNIATKTKNYGKDFFDYNENEIRTRRVCDFTYETNILSGNTYKVISKVVFKTQGLASNKDSFSIEEEEFYNDNKELSEKYKFGDKINISEIGQSNCVNLTGFALEKVNFTVLSGCNISRNACLTINSEKTDTDVSANFNINKVYSGSQTIKFKIKGEEIYTTTVKQFDNKNISFNIPKEIWNSNDIINIEMEFPDAELGKYYATMLLAIRLDSIEFNN